MDEFSTEWVAGWLAGWLAGCYIGGAQEKRREEDSMCLLRVGFLGFFALAESVKKPCFWAMVVGGREGWREG